MYNHLLIYNIVQWLILTREKVFFKFVFKANSSVSFDELNF